MSFNCESMNIQRLAVDGEQMCRTIFFFQTSPYLIRRNGHFKGNEQYEGYCADLAKEIGNYLERDYEIIPVHDGKYGAVNDNGTWDGMVGELVDNVSRIK